MDLDQIKKYLSLFLTALGIFAIVFIIYSIFLISRYAQQQQEIKKGYATEKLTPSPSPRLTK